MAGTTSRYASALLADLFDAPPPIRRAWIRTELSDRDFVEVTLAAERELGSRYGIFQDDPVGFVEIALGETLYPLQVRTYESVVENERTAVPSCHDSGKSHGASRLLLWHCMVWPVGTAKAVSTATRWRQVRNELWPHVRRAHARGRLPGRCLQTELQLGDLDEPVAYGFSPDDYDETAFGGIHAPHVFLLVDEAGGISPVLGRAMEAAMTGEHVRMLLIGNPPFDETGSPWFEERCEKPTYEVVRIPAWETPNFLCGCGHDVRRHENLATGETAGGAAELVGGCADCDCAEFERMRTDRCLVHPDLDPHPIADHLVSRSWVRTIHSDYGPDDPYTIARVDADFPKNIGARVIPATLVEDSVQNDDYDDSTWVRLGVDVAAGGGDEVAIARAEGFLVREVLARRPPPDATPYLVAGWVLEQIEAAEEVRRRLGSNRPVRVKIDEAGVGWGPTGILAAWRREGRHRAEIIGVNVGEAPDTKAGKEKYLNKRAEMWFLGRDLSSRRPVGDEDPTSATGPPTWKLVVSDTARRQLSQPNREYHSSGRRKVESKDDMRDRGVSSPDRAEAALLAVYEPRPTGGGRVSRYRGTLPRASDN